MPQGPKQIDPIGRLPGDTGPAKGTTPGRLPTDVQVKPTEGLSGKLQSYSYDDFQFQPKLNQDNYLLRAQNQSGWQQAGRFLGNLVPNIAGSLIENVGYLGAVGTEWGNDRDYSNVLTKLGQSMHNSWFGDIYREHPNQVWDPGDPAWWYNNAESLVESATAFAGEGAAIGKIFGTLGKATRLARLGKLGAEAENAFAHIGTAATLAYTEAAQFGGTTYDTTYREQYRKLRDQGASPAEADEHARHMASQGAAAAVQLNTIFATGLNALELTPFFKSDLDVVDSFKKVGRREAGESMVDYETRLRALNSGDSNVAKMLNLRKQAMFSYLGTALTEGTEEVVNQWAEQRGLARGKEGKELKGLGDLLGDMSHFFDDTMNQSGALSFVLGGFGGVAQNVLLENLPIDKVYQKEDGSTSLRQFDAAKTADGKYQTKLVSARYRNDIGNRAYFDNIKDAILHDVAHVNSISKKLEQAIAKNDHLEAERLRFKMFDTAAMNSIQLGMGDMFTGQYEDIGKLDNNKSLHENLIPQAEQLDQAIATTEGPTTKQELVKQRGQLQDQMDALTGVTEAMQKGFAKSPTDNEYKKKAQDAVSDINEYQKLWDDISKKYRNDDEWNSRYADYLFGKEVDTRRKAKINKAFEEHIRQAEAARDLALPGDVDPVAIRTISDILTNNVAREELKADVTDISKAKVLLANEKTKSEGEKLLTEIASKFLPNTDSIDDLGSATNQVVSKIKDRLKELDKQFLDNMEATQGTTQYQEWLKHNSKKSVLDYIKTQAERNAVDEEINQDKAELKVHQEQVNISHGFLKELRTARGKADYIKKAKATTNKIVAKMNERVNRDNKAYIDNLFDEKSADDLNQVQKEQYVEALQNELVSTNTKLQGLQTEYNTTAESRKEMLDRGLISRFTNVRGLYKNQTQLVNLSNIIEGLKSQISYLENKLQALATSPVVEENLPKVTNTALDSLKNVTDEQVDAVMQNFIDDKAMYRSILTTVVSLQPAPHPELIARAHQIINSALSKAGRPTIALDTNLQIAFWNIADRWIDKYITTAGLVRTEEQAADLNTNEVILAVKAATSSQKRQAAILGYLDEYEQALKSGRETFSLNALDEAGFVGKGRISQAKAANIMQAFATQHEGIVKQTEEYTPSGTKTEEIAPVIPVQVQEKEKVPDTIIDDIPETDTSDSTIGQNLPTDIDEFTSLELDAIAHMGGKVAEAAIKINALTHDYEQDIHQTEDGTYYINKDVYLLNDAVNPLYLQPGYLKPGDEVRLVIDDAWAGSVNETTKFTYGMPSQKSDKFNDYVDPKTNGISMNPDKYGNMPVKIVDMRSGTTLGYLPRVDWIRAQYPNAQGDYRNVIDVKYDKDGNVILEDNVNKQAEANRLLREKLATAYNLGKKEGLNSTIISREVGTILRTTAGRVTDLMPDTNIQLALFGTTEARVGATTPVEAEASSWMQKNKRQNVPGMLLPAPNGKMVFEPIWTDKVSKADIDTIIRAIEVYYSVDGDVKLSDEILNKARQDAEYIKDSTGFDPTTSDGLKGFINQYYTYTQGFNDAEVKANQEVLKGKKRQPTFMLAIADTSGVGFKKSIVKAGVSYLNRLTKAKVNTQGKIDNAFRKLLEDQAIGLASRGRNVIFTRPGLKGINSTGRIQEIVYHPESQDWHSNDHKSYNDMIKSISKTTVYGKLTLNTKINPQVKKDTYVYFANPVTQMDYKGTISQDIRVTRKPKKIPTDIDTPVIESIGVETKKVDIEKIKSEIKYLQANNAAPDAISRFNTILNSITSNQRLFDLIGAKDKNELSGWIQSNRGEVDLGIRQYESELNKKEKGPERTEAEKEYIKNLPDPLGEDMGTDLDFKPRIVYQSAGDVPGIPVTLEGLESLLTFTPVENRNGKVPVEILEELTKLGLTTLPNGFNPFYTC